MARLLVDARYSEAVASEPVAFRLVVREPPCPNPVHAVARRNAVTARTLRRCPSHPSDTSGPTLAPAARRTPTGSRAGQACGAAGIPKWFPRSIPEPFWDAQPGAGSLPRRPTQNGSQMRFANHFGMLGRTNAPARGWFPVGGPAESGGWATCVGSNMQLRLYGRARRVSRPSWPMTRKPAACSSATALPSNVIARLKRRSRTPTTKFRSVGKSQVSQGIRLPM
jgi:hypothetical protein